MKGLKQALLTELLKARKSKMLPVTISLFAFVALMMGLMMQIALHPEYAAHSDMFSSKSTFVKSTDWKGYFGLLVQLILTLGNLGFGVVAAWVFGREYSDRVITDLLALPVSRFRIVSAKFLITLGWCLLLTLTLLATALITGSIIHLEGSRADIVSWSRIFLKCGGLTILYVTPVAWVASYGKGYLLAIGYVLLTLIITQFMFLGLPGLTPYFPWAIPALSSGIAGADLPAVGPVSYAILVLTCLAGYFGTAAWWQYADQK